MEVAGQKCRRLISCLEAYGYSVCIRRRTHTLFEYRFLPVPGGLGLFIITILSHALGAGNHLAVHGVRASLQRDARRYASRRDAIEIAGITAFGGYRTTMRLRMKNDK